MLQGLEALLKQQLIEKREEEILENMVLFFQNLVKWEAEEIGRRAVLIGSDITKGIVPVEAENRAWRDLAGRTFREAAGSADEVDVIWHGLNQKVKQVKRDAGCYKDTSRR